MPLHERSTVGETSSLEVVEICAGAGGQSLGLHLAGFRHRLAVELDETAAATLRHNLAKISSGPDSSSPVAVGDVADETVWKPDDYHGIDLLAGGVPCPPFSVAGKQLGASDERDLFAWAVSLAGRIKPKALMLENVRGLNSTRFGGYRQAVADELARLGYVANWELLEAREYGVPQLRPRMVLVALQEEYAPYFEWPRATPTNETVATALAHLMGAEWDTESFEEWLSRANRIAPTIVGGSKKHGGADLGPTRAKRAWAEMWVDAHGVADSAPDASWRREDHPRGPQLTVEMVARLQGWGTPDLPKWEFLGRKTARYRQIGNAFPPPVARAVAAAIRDALLRKPTSGSAHSSRGLHDEVYRTLRDAGSWITATKIAASLGGQLSTEQVNERLRHIERDFTVETRRHGGRVSYRLGEWKAFTGQADHDRHHAFLSTDLRRRIS
jgi:DNA (cytosine-5)-methyltransferase 1